MKRESLIGNKGQSLVEILIGLALIVLGVGFATILVFGGQKTLMDRENAVEARTLASEGIEATLSIRDRDWNFLVDGEHGLVFTNGEWQFSSSSDINGLLTRKIIITAESENTKRIESEVVWKTDPLRPQEVKFVTLVTNWVIYEETGGDTGGSGLTGNWQNPQTLGSVDIGAGNSATDLDVKNKIVYMSVEASDPKKSDFIIVDAQNGQNPAVIATLNTGAGLNAVDVAGNYAYVGNKATNAQLQIIDVSNISNPALIRSFQLPGVSGSGAVGQSVFYYSGKIFIGTKKASGPEFHIIDVSDPQNPAALGSKEINADVNAIYVSDNIVYLAISDSNELAVLNVNDPANILSLSVLDLPGDSEDGKALQLVNNNLYFGRTVGGNHTNHHEFHIIDVSSSSAPYDLGSVDLAASINDLRIVDNLAFLGTSDSNKEFQIWNISNPADIAFWSAFNFSQIATGIDYEDNYVYVSVRSNDGLRIITSSP